MTLRDVTGSLFDSPCEAWVNPVNALGVSGAGLALAFKQRFPAMQARYEAACRAHLELGGAPFAVLVWQNPSPTPRFVLCAATKYDWRKPSTMPRICRIAAALAEAVARKGIRSIAVPALGCGLGGLDWQAVRPVLVEALAPLPVDVDFYPPLLARRP